MSKQNQFLLCLIMSNLGELMYILPKKVKLEIRRLEKCFLKLQIKELSCAFNRTCLNEYILQKYTHIQTHTGLRNHSSQQWIGNRWVGKLHKLSFLTLPCQSKAWTFLTICIVNLHIVTNISITNRAIHITLNHQVC